jgi:hypothetical protein
MGYYPEATTAKGLAAASFGLGIFSLLTSWLFPFGVLLGAAGILAGLIGGGLGLRTGIRGEWFAPGGLLMSAAGLGVSLALGWGTYLRVFGL